MHWQKQGYKYWHLLNGDELIAEVAGYCNNYTGFINGRWIGESADSEQEAIEQVNQRLKQDRRHEQTT